MSVPPGPGRAPADDLPRDLPVDGTTFVVERATQDDVADVVALLRDDALGAGREAGPVGDLRPYLDAFAVIGADPNQLLVVVRDPTGRVVATAQLTFLRTLSRQGGLRLQVEAVRVAGAHRGAGLGRGLMGWVADVGRARGAVLAQLTTDRRRVDAHRFYERLGWVDSHKGMKLDLADPAVPTTPPAAAAPDTSVRTTPTAGHGRLS